MTKIIVASDDIFKIVEGHLRAKGLDVDAADARLVYHGDQFSRDTILDGIEFQLKGVQGKVGAVAKKEVEHGCK